MCSHVKSSLPPRAGRDRIELLRDVQTEQVSDESSDSGGPPGIDREGYSLSWFTGTHHGRRFLTHGGGYLGTATYVSFLPEEKVGVVVLRSY
jgi:hypothetical protein